MSTGLRDDLFILKSKLEELEKELTDQMMALEVKAEKWGSLDDEAENLVKINNHNIFLDVGGKKFQTKLDTLLSIKDTLFYKLVLDHKIDITQEIFIDRSNSYFHVILSFLRNKKVNFEGFSSKDLKNILEEAIFYEMSDLIDNINECLSEVKITDFHVNEEYMSGQVRAGTQSLDDINNHEDRTLLKGICAKSPGKITFTMNREVEFEQIEVGGWAGNTGIWATNNGANAKVMTSVDNNTWTQVGTVGSNIISIEKVKLTKSKAKYILIDHTSFVGVGFFRVIKYD
jgi:hypothetical protein